MQEVRVYNKEDYLAAWVEMLGAFLGWSEEQVLSWARSGVKWTALDDPHDIIYHESPYYWMKHLLIPTELQQRLSPEELRRLESRLWTALQDKARYMFPPDTDWHPLKHKISLVLAEYGAQLPVSPAREY